VGITRQTVSAKLDELPILLLDTLGRDMLPFTLTRSAALNMSLHALIQLLPGQTMEHKARALQDFLRQSCPPLSPGQRGIPGLPEPQGVLDFKALERKRA
jgi:hypothetical protein